MTTRAETLRSYVDAYLREEIQAEALVRDIGGYARLLDLVAAASGRLINLHALSCDAGVSYETARRYTLVCPRRRDGPRCLWEKGPVTLRVTAAA